MEQLTLAEATEFFAEFYGGEHHIPNYKVKDISNGGFEVYHDRGSISTYDYSELTRLVFMAHEKCIRVGIGAKKNGVLFINIFKRQREGDMILKHPTLEEALENYNNFKNKK